MTTFQVWHNKNFLDFEKYKYKEVDTVYLPENDFGVVAFVNNVPSLDDAFELTNNIDQPWVYNEGVVPFSSAAKYRSTSVGDVIRNFDTDEWFIVMPMGFKKFKFLESKEQACEILDNEKDALRAGNFRTILKYVGTQYLMERENA
jgi:hypothetical protein